MFPHLASETFWDKLAGLPIFAIVTYGARFFLIYEQIFHLFVHVDIHGVDTVHIDLIRRMEWLHVFYIPAVHREALVSDEETLVRNIKWWGVRGVDRCIFCFRFGTGAGSYH